MNAETQPQASTKPAFHMLNEVGDFIRQFLICSDYQAIILTLWVLHTWCYRAFATTPYLNIQSPGPQCGKTLCLQLLRLLSPPGSWLTSAPAPSLFMRKLLALKPGDQAAAERPQDLPSVVLLDNREFTIGNSDRHPIVPFLNSGFSASDRYLYRFDRSSLREFSVFCPKAFAGIDPLPRSLASRCLDFKLQRKQKSEKIQSFDPDSLVSTVKPFTAWMRQWSEQNYQTLAARARLRSMAMDKANARQQELAKPLLLLADCVGGRWLENLLNSFQWIFLFPDPDGLPESFQLLADLSAVFRENRSPAYIATRDLIPYLRQLDHRPWSKWGNNPSHALARLLRPFGISSRPQRVSSDTVIRVYRCEDLEDAWSRYL